MSIEEKLKQIFKEVLDIEPSEIQNDKNLDQALGIDSTEMVEITVAIKKAFNIDIENNSINKSQSLNNIVEFLKSKGV